MTWCNDCEDEPTAIVIQKSAAAASMDDNTISGQGIMNDGTTWPCPSCGQQIKTHGKGRIHDLPGLPAGVKFDPSDNELLEHLEGKLRLDALKLHPLIDEFIPTLQGENGICYTHPEKLPGVSKDGLVKHFFHRPSKAYTTGTRKRRKVHTDMDGSETRWHKTGKTRPVFATNKLKGYKKILVLYTNYGKLKKAEKTNWVMHQYHLRNNEDEKEGEFVVSKIFYQTQPRQCGSMIMNAGPTTTKSSDQVNGRQCGSMIMNAGPTTTKSSDQVNGSALFDQYYNSTIISFRQNHSSNVNP